MQMKILLKKLFAFVLCAALLVQTAAIAPVVSLAADFESDILNKEIYVQQDFEGENPKSPLNLDASPYGPTGEITDSPTGDGKAIRFDSNHNNPFTPTAITSEAKSAAFQFDIYVPEGENPRNDFLRVTYAGNYCSIASIKTDGKLTVTGTELYYELIPDEWHTIRMVVDYDGARAIVFAGLKSEAPAKIGEAKLTAGSKVGISRYQQGVFSKGKVYFDNYLFEVYADLYAAINNCTAPSEIKAVLDFYEGLGIFTPDADIGKAESEDAVYKSLLNKDFKSNAEFNTAYLAAIVQNYSGIRINSAETYYSGGKAQITFANTADVQTAYNVYHLAFATGQSSSTLIESSQTTVTLPAYDEDNPEYETISHTFENLSGFENVTVKTVVTKADTDAPVKCITYGAGTASAFSGANASLTLESDLDTESGVFSFNVSGAGENELVFINALGGRYIDAAHAGETGCVSFKIKPNGVIASDASLDSIVTSSSDEKAQTKKAYPTDEVSPVIEKVILSGESQLGGSLEASFEGYFQLGGLEADDSKTQYRWYVSDTAEDNGTLIDGAQSSVFEINDDSYGEKFITASIVVTSQNGVASKEHFSNPSAVLLPPRANNVKVSGAPVEDNILSASYEYYHVSNPEVNSVIRWISIGSDGEELEELSAGSLEYRVKKSDIGKTIAFSITPMTDVSPEKGITVTVTVGEVKAKTAQTTAPVASKVEIADSYEENTLVASYEYSHEADIKAGDPVIKWFICDTADGEYEPAGDGAEFEYRDEYADKYVKVSITPVSENDIRGETVMSEPMKMYSVPEVTDLRIAGRTANDQKLTAHYAFSEELSGYDKSKIKWYIDGELISDTAFVTTPADSGGKELKLVISPVSAVFPHVGKDAVVSRLIDSASYADVSESAYVKTETVAPASKYSAGNMETYTDTAPLKSYGENTYLVVDPAKSSPWITGFEADGIVTVDMRVYLTPVEGRTEKSGEQIRFRHSDNTWGSFFVTFKSGKITGNDEITLNENQWFNLRLVLDNDDKTFSAYYGSDINHLERIELSDGRSAYNPPRDLGVTYLQFAIPTGADGALDIWNINSLKLSSMPPMYRSAKEALTAEALKAVMDEYERYNLFDYPADFDTVDDKELVLKKVLAKVNDFESTKELEQYFSELCTLHQNGASVVNCKIYSGSEDVSDGVLSGITSVKSITELVSTDSMAKTLYVLTALYEKNANGDKTLRSIDVKEAELSAEGTVSVTSAALPAQAAKEYSVSVLVWDKQALPYTMLSVKSFNDTEKTGYTNEEKAPSDGITVSACTINKVTGQVIVEGNASGGDGQYLSFEVTNPSGDRIYADEIYTNSKNGTFRHTFTLASPSASGSYTVTMNLNKTGKTASSSFEITEAEAVEPTVRGLSIKGDNYLEQTVNADYEYFQLGGVAEKGTVYKWYISSNAENGYELLEGENSRELYLDENYKGKYIKAEVTPASENGISGQNYASEPVRVLVAPSVSNVKISGDVKAGKTVSVTYKFSEELYGSPESGTKYEWYVGSKLAGTDQSYKISSSDSGKYLECIVTPGIEAYPFYGEPVSTGSVRIEPADSGKSGGGGGGGGGSAPSAVVLPQTQIPGISSVGGTSAENTGLSVFADTADHWANATINNLYAQNIVNGIDANHYNPEGKVTRAEFAALINRITGHTAMADIIFGDVPADAWYYDDIRRILSAGIMQGSDALSFRPDDCITREEMALVARRVYTYKYNTVPNITQTKGFADFADISPWAYDAVMYCQNAGIVIGDQNGNYNPKSFVTRAEAAVVIERLMNLK